MAASGNMSIRRIGWWIAFQFDGLRGKVMTPSLFMEWLRETRTVVPVFITIGAHQVLFNEFHAGWYSIFGFSGWRKNLKPAEEARSNGIIHAAIGLALGLLIWDWRGLLMGGAYVGLLLLIKRVLPKTAERLLYWLAMIPIVTMFPFLRF
jgi:hypothetical protein